MRLDDLERLAAVHSKMVESTKHLVRNDGDFGYMFGKTRDAIEAVAERIKLGLTNSVEIQTTVEKRPF